MWLSDKIEKRCFPGWKRLPNPFGNPLHRKKQDKILKYDLHILKNYGIDVKGVLFDTMVSHFLLKPDQKHNLNILAEQYLDYSMVKIEELIGKKGARQVSFGSVPLEQAKEYACEDADITQQLAIIFKAQLSKEGFTELSEKIEMPLVQGLDGDGTPWSKTGCGCITDFCFGTEGADYQRGVRDP